MDDNTLKRYILKDRGSRVAPSGFTGEYVLKHHVRSVILTSLVVLFIGLPPSAVLADSRDDDRFRVEIGAFLQAFETTLRLDSETLGRGTEIDLESDLGLMKDQDNFRLDGAFRMGRKHRIEFGYVSWNRSNSHVIDEEIHWGEETYPINATIRTSIATDVYKLSYKYSFVNNDRFEAGISGGFSVFDLFASLDAEADGGDAGFESEDVIAPVPLLGGFFDWKISPNLVLRTTGELFDLSTGGLNGHMSDLKGTINWYPWRNIGIGAGFNRVSLRYLNEGPAELEFKYVYSGVTAFVIFSF
jgi:hypothetical protein